MKYIDQFGETGTAGTDREHLTYPTKAAVCKDGSILVGSGIMNDHRLVRLSED